MGGGSSRIAPLRHYCRIAPGQTSPIGPPAGCLEVALSKDPNDRDNSRFGFANVPATNGRALLITWVDSGGLLGKWNREHPDKIVHECDMIFAVNSATEDVDAMRTQLHMDAIRMLVQPGHAANSMAPTN